MAYFWKFVFCFVVIDIGATLLWGENFLLQSEFIVLFVTLAFVIEGVDELWSLSLGT